jgi:uncharacterized protein (TIGR04255 family)
VRVDHNPLIALPPGEIPLPNAPLVRVIAQARFPIIASIEKREFIASFQEALRATYPVLRLERTEAFVIGPAGVALGQSPKIWRFTDIDGKWRVSLAPDFIALETTAYSSRSDFLDRLHVALSALNAYIGPKLLDRLGLRYIDRIIGEAIDNITELVRSEMIGVLATPMAAYAQHALSESLLTIPGTSAQLLARWGKIPPHMTIDPAAIEPVEQSSWLLDLDMFSIEPQLFDPTALVDEARIYAERIYALFRWAVTDKFLRQYGGNI